jgi:predicted ATPase/transcriptional regulator with XRE-family HTH domain/predicted negative regulator of RcsB-dependent stress response
VTVVLVEKAGCMSHSSVPLASFATFGELLKFLRRRAQLSQTELSIAVGYSESQISRLENNRRCPDRTSLLARFIPALHIADEPETVARLLMLAETSRAAPIREDAKVSVMTEPTPAALAAVTDQPSPRRPFPLQLTSLIGRREEVTEVCDLLRGGQTRLVTLTGAGGIGKTRLALAAGEALAAAYMHGAWLAELAALADPNLLPKAVAATFDLDERPDQPLVAVLTDFLRPRHTLLILDNCEHLVEAVAPLAEGLLRACPHLQILATSRETLRISGETVFHVQPLALPPEQGSVPALRAAVEGYDAIQLFVERARTALRTFVLTNQNAAAVAAICRRLDGMPLGIELAAGWVNLLRPEEIAGRLEADFDLLVGSSRTGIPRHRTLAAAMEWSYNLLPETERLLLRRLSVFAGGWTLEAAEAVVPSPPESPTPLTAKDVLSLLSRLVSKSLVTVEHPAGAETRYRMLEPIREYLQEKLAATWETTQLRERHLAYCVALAEAAEPELRSRGQLAWLGRLDAEQDNYRAALSWSLTQRKAVEGLRLVAALGHYWEMRFNLEEGKSWCETVLALANEDAALQRSAWQGKALFASGLLAVSRYDSELARRHLEESLSIAQELGDATGSGIALCLLGIVQDRLGNSQQAWHSYQAGSALLLRAEDAWWLAETLHWMGHALDGQGNRREAAHYYQQATAISRETGDRWALSRLLTDLAWCIWDEGRLREALALMQECLAAFCQLRAQGLVLMSLKYVSLMAVAVGEYEAAARAIQDAREGVFSRGLHNDDAIRLYVMGSVDFARGHLRQARQQVEAALTMAQPAADPRFAADVMHLFGCIAVREGLPDEAAGRFQESRCWGQQASPYPIWSAQSLFGLGQVAAIRGDFAQAATLYRESLTQIQASRPEVPIRLEGLAQAAVGLGQIERAAKLLAAASHLRATMGAPILPVDQPHYDETLATVRAALREEDFNQAWAIGEAMSVEMSITYALEGSTLNL